MNRTMTAQALETSGFHVTRFQDLRNRALSSVPPEEGAYVVLRRSPVAPVFLAESCGGHFKGKNPTVSTHCSRRSGSKTRSLSTLARRTTCGGG